MAITRLKTSGVYGSKYIDALAGLPAVMAAPTATDGGTGTTASIAFVTQSGATSYTALSNPGSLTGTGASSPVTVSGLTTGTAYTFQIAATNAQGTGGYSAASNSVTPAVPIVEAYESIASEYVGGTANTITFSSIPQTYKALELRINAKTSRSGGADNLYIQFNGDTGSNYAYAFGGRDVDNSPSVLANSASDTSILFPDFLPTTNNTTNPGIFGYTVTTILDYALTNKTKTVQVYGGRVSANSGGTLYGRVGYGSGVWNNTAAITSITITNSSPTFNTGSVFSLYGLKG
jgi:hypothetical protein